MTSGENSLCLYVQLVKKIFTNYLVQGLDVSYSKTN